MISRPLLKYNEGYLNHLNELLSYYNAIESKCGTGLAFYAPLIHRRLSSALQSAQSA